jgi:hypothetical protein
MKSEDGQVFLSTADHMEHYKKLKSLKNNIENLSGDYWNWRDFQYYFLDSSAFCNVPYDLQLIRKPAHLHSSSKIS